jgi:acetyl-CoA carboxylase biotin carboxyl carrier protein
MEVKQINQLMLAMGRYGIKKLSLKKEGFEIELEREGRFTERAGETFSEEGEENPLHSDFAKRRAQGLVSQETFVKAEAPAVAESEASSKEEEEGVFIDAPMVGTIYLAPTPNDPVFVKKGDSIDENTVVCLVEAMKVMNEVKAGVKGVIAEVLVENAHPVEYGTRLFRVVPAS